jgi:hypothetical protein
MFATNSRIARIAATAVALAAAGAVFAKSPTSAKVTAVPGQPVLALASYDLADVGYQVGEWFISGTATSYRLRGSASADGAWNVSASTTAPYKTRVVVARPSDPAKFNGTVLVEWLNVSAGQDAGAEWIVEHREMIRKGYVWVGVSAQKAGIDGGGFRPGGIPLKKADLGRYGTLDHPGDAFSFDIFSQAGRALNGSGHAMLGGLVPRRMIGAGDSQSAVFLTTYINAIDPLARVYDGFFVHSRFGTSAALSGASIWDPEASPPYVRFRPRLRVPVLTFITETDLLGGAALSGYSGARQPDSHRLRVWEVAGAAHADSYIMAGSRMDSGKQDAAALAKIFQPPKPEPGDPQAVPVNPGMPHHYVAQAALAALDTWLRTGRPPASTAPLVLAHSGADADLVRDGSGIAHGGIRTPWTDVPTVRLSGKIDPNSKVPMLTGSGVPLTQSELATLYPNGKAEYLRRFTASLDAAIRAGHILPDDREEILEIASINFDAAS